MLANTPPASRPEIGTSSVNPAELSTPRRHPPGDRSGAALRWKNDYGGKLKNCPWEIQITTRVLRLFPHRLRPASANKGWNFAVTAAGEPRGLLRRSIAYASPP